MHAAPQTNRTSPPSRPCSRSLGSHRIGSIWIAVAPAPRATGPDSIRRLLPSAQATHLSCPHYRLARSVPDARHIADALVERGVKLALGASVYDPTDPMGKMFFNILATFAEFEADLIRLRTREGMAIARAKGKLRGKRPKLSDKQHKELWRMYETGEYSISDLAELFSVSRPTVYRTLARKTPRSAGS